MRRPLVLLVGLIVLGSTLLEGQGTESRSARLETEWLVAEYMRDQHVPGASVAIVVGDSVAYARGFGWANLEDSVTVTPRTLFPSASTLKLLTATSVLQLAERGKLSLQETIQRHCPAYPSKRWPITIAQLLAHQGGVRPSVGVEVFNRVHYGSIRKAVAGFANDTLVARPGTKQIYSNAGYVLLACAIEGASGESFDQYLRRNIFGPADMTASEESSLYRVIPHRAAAYMVRTEANTRNWNGLWTADHLAETTLDVPFRAHAVDESFATGASNYLTTPTDLARFVIALNRGKLIGGDLIEAMLSDHPTSDGQATGRGYPWLISRSGGSVVARLAGSVWIGSSAVLFLPREHFAAIVSTNLGFQQPNALLDSLAAVWGHRINEP